jgi:hypothetical protein
MTKGFTCATTRWALASRLTSARSGSPRFSPNWKRVAFPVATRLSTADIGRRFAIGSTDGVG